MGKRAVLKLLPRVGGAQHQQCFTHYQQNITVLPNAKINLQHLKLLATVTEEPFSGENLKLMGLVVSSSTDSSAVLPELSDAPQAQ
jgi:hypothetical protein